MCRAVYISAVLHLDGFLDVGNELPEFSFNVILCHGSHTIENGVEGHAILEIALLKVRSFLLELFERIETTFLEAELSITDEASRAIPLPIWLSFERRVEAKAVVSMVA
jgi:hypothetical protein